MPSQVDAKTLSHVVGRLVEDQPYMFRVSAVNAEGQGKPLLTDLEVKPKTPPGKLEKGYH